MSPSVRAPMLSALTVDSVAPAIVVFNPVLSRPQVCWLIIADATLPPAYYIFCSHHFFFYCYSIKCSYSHVSSVPVQALHSPFICVMMTTNPKHVLRTSRPKKRLMKRFWLALFTDLPVPLCQLTSHFPSPTNNDSLVFLLLVFLHL